MATTPITTYGPGGYDPDAPDGNVVGEDVVPVAPEVETEQTMRERGDQALSDLRQVRDSSGTLTGAQLSQAVRVMARVLIALVRLVLRKLDDTE